MREADTVLANWREGLAAGGLILAHRGARSLAPENTLAAARAAHGAGAHGWEFDVSLTADGLPLLIHDDTLSRTSNARRVYPGRRPWRVADFSWQEIQALDFGFWFEDSDPFGQIAAGRVSRQELARFKGEPATSLAQALAFSQEQGLLVNLELKDLGSRPSGPDPAALVAGMVAEMGMLETVLVSSFNHAYLRTVAALQPELALGVLVRQRIKDPLGLVRELGASSYHPRENRINQAQLRELAAAGIAVIPWTVNQPSQARALFAAGASGIITDYPQLMKEL
jgi:glycerophosphoryl diester phosphodiesterase